MSIFGRVKRAVTPPRAVRKAVGKAADVLEGAGKLARDKVREETAGLPIAGVVNSLTSINFRDDPLGGVVEAHLNAGKFLMSEQAGAIGLAAATGGAGAAAFAAGGSRGAAIMGAAESGDFDVSIKSSLTGYAKKKLTGAAAGALKGSGIIDDSQRLLDDVGATVDLASSPRPKASNQPKSSGRAGAVTVSASVSMPGADTMPGQPRGLIASILAIFGIR